MGSIVEQNLASVTYDIWASADLTKELSVSDSILAQMKAATENNPNIPAAYDGNLETSSSIDVSFMSSMVTQGMINGGTITEDTPIKIRMVITATDEVGNVGTYSSEAYNDGKDFIIYQETDRPQISFTNASEDVDSESKINVDTNLFLTTNNKLSLSIRDDDGVNAYSVSVVGSDQNEHDGSKVALSKVSTNFSKMYLLPEDVGVYKVKVTAYDTGSLETALNSSSYGKATSKEFYIAVDSGAPTVTAESVAAYLSPSDKISGSISPSAKGFENGTEISATFLDSELNVLSSQPATLTATKSGTSWSFPLSSMPKDKSGSYTLRITATDKYVQTGSTTVKFGMDPIAPTIAEPTSEQTVKLDESSYVTLNVVVSDDTDGSGLSTVGYYLSDVNTAPSYDSVSWNAMNQTNTDWRTTFDISSVKNEDGILYAFFGAKDNAGNTKVSASSIKLTIDKTAPAIKVTGFDGNAEIASNGTSKTTSGNSFSVTVIDTNVASLSSSKASVSVGSPSEVTGGKSYPVTVSWSSTNGKIEDSQTVTFTATDANGRTSAYTVTLSCDNSAPVVTLDDYAEYASSSVELTGTVSDTNFTKTSSNFKVYLLPADSAKTTKSGIVTFGDSNTSWSATFTGLEETSYDIVVVAKDSFGNSSAYRTGTASVPAEAGFIGEALAFIGEAFKVDVNAPELTENSVTIGTSSLNASQTENFYYNGGSDSIYISGQATDLGSGIASVVILPYSKTATDEITATYDSATNTFSATIENSKITKSGTIYAKITDNAGNENDVSLVAITFDATNPQIPNATIEDSSSYTAYKSGEDNYYVNNVGGNFTISGVATDNLGLESVSLSITDGEEETTPIEPSLKDSENLSEWTFENISLASLHSPATATVTVVDMAGNTATKNISLVFDVDAPHAEHDFDAKGKDIYFRVGGNTTDVGGKYYPGTYGDSNTIRIRGTFTEEGSGTDLIYFKVFKNVIPEASQIEAFKTNYASDSDNTGYFSPSESTATVQKNTSADGDTYENVSVTSTFNTTISLFDEGNNYLILLAVDKVGNAALDWIEYTYTPENASSAVSLNCYSINVDSIVPDIISDVSSTILTNKNSNVENISGTASDSAAGIRKLVFTVNEKEIVLETDKASSVDTDDGSLSWDKTNSKWQVTVKKSVFSSVEEGNFTAYLTAYDNAGDVGNKNNISVATISVDNVEPTITLNVPSDALKSTTATDVNKMLSLSGNAEDGNPLTENEDTTNLSNTITGIRYVKVDSEDSDAPANNSSSWGILNDIDGISVSVTGNYSFSTSKIDTTKLDDENFYYIQAVGVDKAGNQGYSNNILVYVNQKSDRPILSFTNLTKNASDEYILKLNDAGTVEVTITDDDSTNSQVVKSIRVYELSSEGTNIGDVQTPTISASGDFTFVPSNSDDGAKYFKFSVTDNNDETFESKSYTTESISSNANYAWTIPVLSVKNTSVEDSITATSSFTYKADNESPVVDSVYALAYDAFGTAEESSSMISAAYYAGGTKRKSVVLTVNASDANGIAGMIATIKNGSTVLKSYKSVATSETSIAGKTLPTGTTWENAGIFTVKSATTADWVLPILDVSLYTGSITISITPYDNSGLTGNSTQVFNLDNEGPTVAITSHKNAVNDTSVQYNGTVTLTGLASDSNDVTKVEWLVPTAEQRSSWASYSASQKASLDWAGDVVNSAVNFTFTGEYLFDEYTSRALSSGTDSVSNTDWYIIPVYFKATDEFGNIGYTTGYAIKFNPDLDKMQTSISNPAENDQVGGAIRVIGNTTTFDGAQEGTSVNSVYVQIGSTSAFPAADRTVAADTYGYSIVSGYDIINEFAGTAYSSSSQPTAAVARKYGFASLSALDSWWGIKSNTTGWRLILNEDGTMNPSGDDVNTVYLRAAAVNTNGKVGDWCDSRKIDVTTGAPTITEKLYQFTSAPTASNLSTVTDTSNVLAEKDYTGGVYIKNQWYLEVTATEPKTNAKVSIESIYRGTNKLTAGTDYFVTTDSTSQVKAYVAIDKDATSTLVYKVTAVDGSEKYSATSTYSINVDNQAPTLSPLYSDSDRKRSISMTKIENSNYVYDLYSSVEEAGSGLDFIAVYFTRDSGTSQKIELPLPTKPTTSGSSSIISLGTAVSELASNFVSEDGLYGIKVTSTIASSDGITTITSDSVSSNGFIRKGMLVKLSGSYYEISSVSDNVATVSTSFGTAPGYAFFPIAIPVNNTTAEGGQSNGTVITNDDGDGFVDYVKSSGSTYVWETEFFSDELDDGEVNIVVVAGDKAGNYSTISSDNSTTTVQLTNHKPRVSKIFLSTDLNGDGVYTDNELGGQAITSSEGGSLTQKFYSALSGSTIKSSGELEGSAQEISTLSYKSTEKDSDGNYYGVGFTMRNKLGVAIEFVSGKTGNNDLYYQLATASSTDGILTSPTSGTKGTVTARTSSLYDTTANTTTAYIVSSALKGFEIPTTDISNHTEWVDVTENTHKLSNIGITLWDSTSGTTAGSGDTKDSDGNYTAFGSQWTVINIPIYIDLTDDKYPVPVIENPVAVENAGHVDLKDTLPSVFTTGNSIAYLDRDTKISGEVTFTGTVKDEKRVNKIYLTTSKNFDSTEVTTKEVATYNTETGEFTLAQPATGLTFAITNNEFSTTSGHSVGWSLTVDSSYVAGIAASDVLFTVAANDGTNTNGEATAVPYATYQVDVVPYITGITAASEKLYRSTFGQYSVFKGDTLTVNGYNLPDADVAANATGTYVHVGSKGVASTNVTANKQFTISVPENSGELSVSVNGILSLNDKNNNANENNQEAKSDGTSTHHAYYYDNRYLRVWDIGHSFKDGDSDAHKPVMSADYDGNLFGIWTRMGDGQVIVEKGLTSTGTRVVQHYDQMAEYSAIGIDKSVTDGAISVLNFNENVGDGGIMTDNAFSHVSNTGGAWGVAIDNKLTIASTAVGTGTLSEASKGGVKIANNPTTALDSNWYTSGYSLASYAMLRDVQKFTSPRTARSGDNMHFVYYDSKDQSLRYTWVKSGASSTEYARNANYTTESWVLIDGNVAGYDRLHDYTSTTNSKDAVSAVSQTSITYDTGTYNGSAYYRLNNQALYNAVPADSTVGIGITYTTTEGTRRILVLDNVSRHTTGNYVVISRALTTEEQAVLSNTSITKKVTIYKGDKNVITSGAAQSSAAGKYSGLDLTSDGHPVIAYYDAGNETLRVAYASDAAPTTYDKWSRVAVTYKTKETDTTETAVKGGSHCALKVDTSGNLHIIYRNSNNNLMYVKGTGTTSSGYKFSTPLLIDDSTTGTWGTISLRNGTTPIVSYLNSEESSSGVKVAILRNVDEGTTYTYDDDGNLTVSSVTTNAFDTMVMPLVSGHNVVGENLVCVEANNSHWNVSEDDVSTGDCDAAVSYQSTQLNVSFLKSEQ